MAEPDDTQAGLSEEETRTLIDYARRKFAEERWPLSPGLRPVRAIMKKLDPKPEPGAAAAVGTEAARRAELADGEVWGLSTARVQDVRHRDADRVSRHDFEHTDWCFHRQLFGRDPVAELVLLKRKARHGQLLRLCRWRQSGGESDCEGASDEQAFV
jgi:hypothetical protein